MGRDTVLLVDEDDDVITLKNQQDIEEIVKYLRRNDLQELIRNNFWKIRDESFRYKDDDGLEHTLGWSEEIRSFYENARKGNYQVIFTVDF